MSRVEPYPSDLTDPQWSVLRPLLPRPGTPGRPVTVDRRRILDAIFYVLRTGCQWRQLPHDFPPWGTVSSQFCRWRQSGLWDKLHDTLHVRVRVQEGRNPRPSAGIIDSQSVRTTEVGGPRGYDGAKQLTGRKRHLLVDTIGLLIALVVHTADVQDEDGARDVLARGKARFPRLKLVWADSRYACKRLPERVWLWFRWVLEVVRRPAGSKGWVRLPRRWVVERTFAWLGRNRRLSKDYERSTQVSETWVRLAMTKLMLRRLKPA